MNKNIENYYNHLPIFMQNLLISLYGYQIHKNRYSGKYGIFKKAADARLRYNNEEMKQYQTSMLCRTLREAYEHVPYYKNLFHKNNISIDSIKEISDLRKIPILCKEDIRRAPHEFINSHYSPNALQIIHTTGSTGTPLNIFCNRLVRQNNYAFYDRFLEYAGLPSHGNRATFGGRIIVPSRQYSPPFWRTSFFQKNLLFSSYHLTDKNIPYYIDALKRFNPDVIDAYPSSLFVIARYALKNNINLKNITKGITTSAETLFPEQREIISEAFGVSIFDQYGAAEMSIFVGQCFYGSYHVHSDYGIVEFLNIQDGTWSKPGEECEFICTGFINPVMPLIRYRIGDIGVVSERKCPCGLHFPILEKLIGRKDDSIITPDGRIIGRLSPVLKGFPIKEAQYIQETRDTLKIIIVKDNDFSEKTEQEILFAIRKRVGQAIKLEISYSDKIERGAGGKLRSVISKIKF